MRLFEPWARMCRRSRDDYRALARCGVAALVEPAAPHGPPRLNAGSFEDAFGALLRWEPSRAAEVGIEHLCALGLPGREAHEPSVADAVLWLLPRLLEKDGVVAVGEIGYDEGTAQEEDVFARQVELARRRGLPVIVRVPARGGARAVERHLALLNECRLPPQSAVLVGIEEPSIGVVRDAGCWACVTVGAGGCPAQQAPVLRRRWGVERLLFTGAPEGCGGDLGGVAAAAAALEAAGEAPAIVERLLWSNPRRFFAQSGRLLEAAA